LCRYKKKEVKKGGGGGVLTSKMKIEVYSEGRKTRGGSNQVPFRVLNDLQACL